MSQFSWTVLGQSGKQYRIGLFHGSRTGHVLIHCNLKVILIDFNVWDSKSYSFFLDEELCELEIEKKEGKFYYGLQINEKANTPLNKRRKAQEKKYMTQTIIVFLCLAALVAVFAVAIPYWQEKRAQSALTTRLLEEGETTSGIITVDSVSKELTYSYVVKGKIFVKKVDPKEASALPFALAEGDEFTVYFNKDYPQASFIRFDYPSEMQLKKYRENVLERHHSLNPTLTLDQVQCQVEAAYKVKELEGWADIYYQATEPEQNKSHNRLSYLRLIRDVPFKKAISEKCPY